MKITFNSPVILFFSITCVVIYIFTGPLGIMRDLFILQPEWKTTQISWYFRLFSHVVGHASTQHLIGNLSFILLLGPIVEERYGTKKLTLMILSTAIITAILHLIFFSNGLLGASGIVFMLIILSSLVNFKNKEIPLTFILVVLIFIGKEIYDSVTTDTNISHFAHIIGGVVGAIFGFILGQKKVN